MGRRGLGTGQPLVFRCTVERREHAHALDWREERAIRERHKVVRTGRTRGPGVVEQPTYSRMLQNSHEYLCRCGHRGWTRHHDILRRPLGCPDGGRCHHDDFCNTVQQCFRTQCCEPLSGVFPNDEWPKAYKFSARRTSS